AIAPTSEYDFDQLPAEKQQIYRYIQAGHTQSAPDGPWFFIIARNNPYEKFFQLIGITDTAMLRPQVFALQDGEVQIGLICSEKQAIDATLQSLAAEDNRFCPVADKYWNARGGSSSDGGSFIFTVKDSDAGDGSKTLTCTNKFGEVVRTPSDQKHYKLTPEISLSEEHRKESQAIVDNFSTSDTETFKKYCEKGLSIWDYETLRQFCTTLLEQTKGNDEVKARAIDVLTHLNDRHVDTGTKKRSSVLQIIRDTLAHIFVSSPQLNEHSSSRYRFIDWSTRTTLRAPREYENILVLNAREFPPEGDECDARLICAAYELGWRQFICYGYKGQRFTGCGLGNDSDGVRIDVYDSSGDYLASGID
ncbi:MAG: glutamate synthase, partial [Thermodesulfobacteriota bacterium]|nr:glutamate synthase [Thermodesulfobacteriota bacterium]